MQMALQRSMTNVDERNHWTLVYNDNGNPIMRLTRIMDAYIKKNGAADNGNDLSEWR